MSVRNRNTEPVQEGYRQSLSLLKRCSTENGFVASTMDVSNYQRIWGRDGNITGLAALHTGEEELIDTYRRTLKTLLEHQGPHGEIPSNVDPLSGRISYGGMAGRVDADLWFIIGCGEYWSRTGDSKFLEQAIPPMERTFFLLGAWEFNNRGFLYIPETGDWADEYLQNGYVLYDQLLYLQAMRTMYHVRKYAQASEDHDLRDRILRRKRMIYDNYWLLEDGATPENVYHEVLYRKSREAGKYCINRYWMPFFTPHGYGYRFDAMANVMASLTGVSDRKRREQVDQHIEKIIAEHIYKLLPAFHPVIRPRDEDWEELQMTFSYHFKNHPHEYHNGGLWPLISGFYAADLALRGKIEKAEEMLIDIHRANSIMGKDGNWSFPEYIHGAEYTPGGTRLQAWSAASPIIAHSVIYNDEPFFHIAGPA